MRSRLLVITRERVRNGELTESHLARLVGISQSHIHNVLKGERKLSPELADEILAHLRLDANDLLEDCAAPAAMSFRSIPLLAGALGRDMERFDPRQIAGAAPVPAYVAAALRRPLAIRLGVDRPSAPRFESGDLVLVEQSVESRKKIVKDAVYVVMTIGGPRLRYVRQGPGRLYLVSEDCVLRPSCWESVSSANLPFTVRGRVVWVSRQLECGSSR